MEYKKILIIEDEIPIADLLAYGLKKAGFDCRTSNNGAEGLKLVEEFNPDLLLLDWMLPDVSGIDICKLITEKNNIPIIMLTAKSDIEDKVLGLEFGAEDYITKPFDMREVVARIKTIFRRVYSFDEQSIEENKKYQFGDIEISEIEHTVKKNEEIIELTPKEYDLLLILYKNRGRVFSRDQLLNSIWEYDFTGDTRTVDMHIQRLRKKLDLNDLIKTVFGVGYKFIK
ncbi:response regulator transcription factor [Tissierella sp. MB52-C2]|uniref:response regulator transcription factor n=1 Tax=Tissierella sp. MB52-C2 TaxID=3070999 RepID=UPI00280AB99A|nr:response regulator transcription factor [Tissierella sp. MB52-C2]WMM23394.1 response regulator transcription factor [Tissierella sp. MB52-C2]